MIPLVRPLGRLLAFAAVGFSLPLVLGTAASAAAQPPYDDPAGSGVVTLCDRELNPVTEGSINDRPFVWRAVGSQAAPAPYDDANRRAALYAFQPREGVSPGLWTGDLLTAASTYTSADHPIAQATVIDFPLRVFLRSYPARWNGSVQLRLYYTTDGQPPSTSYATTDLQITGDRWRALNPGSAPCDAGDAVSPETLLPNFEKSAKAVEAKNERQDGSTEQPPTSTLDPTSSTPSVKTSDAPESTDGSAQAGGAAVVDDAATSDSSSAPMLIGGGILLVLVVGGAAAWRLRRR